MQLLRRLIPRKKFAGLDNSDLLRAMHEVALVDVPENRKSIPGDAGLLVLDTGP